MASLLGAFAILPFRMMIPGITADGAMPKGTQAPPVTERFFAATNAERVAAGLQPYTWNARAAMAAQARADDLVARDYFGHVTPDGASGYVEELARQGVITFILAGENLSQNNYQLSETIERAMITLMNSPTHRENILDQTFDSCGVGYRERPTGVHVFVAIFLAGVGP